MRKMNSADASAAIITVISQISSSDIITSMQALSQVQNM